MQPAEHITTSFAAALDDVSEGDPTAPPSETSAGDGLFGRAWAELDAIVDRRAGRAVVDLPAWEHR